ncbi:putative mucin/carbohydrate-binding domain-containing protein [Pseudomonas sp. A-R-19]|uniref:putative mucin/carbohydrate-binding domain-containing protein n=1 Tax=Pseudomonas sp. A-R-19 TaxID=2832403 RepID=UPI001CBBA57D|nr:putative mucin/carbohydrate-binding domain-containing protein [Pseudomonas sp. A-R-19]
MANEETRRYTQQIYSLERPDWLHDAGLSKGVFHDRKSTSLIVPAGKAIRFRQSFPEASMGITLNLLNDDSAKESHHVVTTQWSVVVAAHASAIFLTTPYTDTAGQQVNIEVEFVSGGASLPTWQAGLNAENFFNEWDRLVAPYALYISDYAMILIPAKDKEVLRRLHETSGLQSLAAYYDGVFEHFNYLAGLSFSPTVPTDKNIPNRYFMKADKSGGGVAYYGGGWIAESNDSVAAFWLDTKGTNWGSIHEIGHGYEGSFMSHSTINLGEVWNNVFAASYQSKVLGDEVFLKGWLYSGGEEQLYTRAMAAFDSGTVGQDVQLTLFFLVLMFQRASDQSIIEFHQRYRRISNESEFYAENYPTMDFLSHVTIDVANIDVSAFMLFAGASLTSTQAMKNSFSNAVPVYPLFALVQQSSLKQIQAQLGLRSPLALVSSADLKISGLTSSVTIKFDEALLAGLRGKFLLLRDGTGAARVVKIQSAVIVVDKLPLGTYALQMPSVGDGEYQNLSVYVVVKDGVNEVDCLYVRKSASGLADQTINLSGLDGVFCKLAVEVSQGRLLVDIVSQSPHSYYSGQVYAEVVVMNAQGSIVFRREMMGDKTELFSGTVLISKEFTIEIMHKEPSRIEVSNATVSAVIDSNAQVNRLKVTERGLVNLSLGTQVGLNLMAEIDKCAKEFEKNPHLRLNDDFPLKQDMRRAINTFGGADRVFLFEKHRTVEFVRPKIDVVVSGLDFTWFLRGNGGRDIGRIRINLYARLVEITFFANSAAHEYFSSVYLSVVLTSATGEPVYVRELRGNAPVTAESVHFPLFSNMVVSVMHREPTRCRIKDNYSQAETPVGHVQHAQIRFSPDSLNLASYWPRETVDS